MDDGYREHDYVYDEEPGAGAGGAEAFLTGIRSISEVGIER